MVCLAVYRGKIVPRHPLLPLLPTKKTKTVEMAECGPFLTTANQMQQQIIYNESLSSTK